MDEQLYRVIKWIAISIGFIVVATTVYQMIQEHYSGASGLDFKTGHLRLEDGNGLEALKSFDKALEIDKENYNARFGKALALMELKRNREAVVLFL